MKDYLISLFIDDEMDIDEKVEFVETVHESTNFKTETIELLEQEKRLQDPMVTRMPPEKRIRDTKPKQNLFSAFLPPLAGFSTALILVAAALWFRPQPVVHPTPHRFVIYQPSALQAQIIGTFTNWQPTPMEKLGTTGYWTLTLNLPEGEHRYSYVFENGLQVPDPTILLREKDDFGGVNSILKIGGRA